MGKTQREKSGKGLIGWTAYTAEMANQMGELYQFQAWLDKKDEDEFDFVSMTIRGPTGEGGDYLVIVRAWIEGQQMVGFHGGATVVECLLGAVRRIKQGGMKWKVDQYGGQK